jgi:hypothetical protein
MKAAGQITAKQLRILTLIYRFRFITTSHVQYDLQLTTIQAAQKRLNILLEYDYIGRQYSKEHKLNGRPASYFLQALGLATLRKHKPGVAPKVLHNIYHDKSADDSFIRRRIIAGDVNVALSQRFGERLTFFAVSELAGYDYMPSPLPDAYFEIATEPSKETYLVEICDSLQPMYKHRKLIKRYIQYKDEGEWEAETDEEMPTVMLVCDNEALFRKLERIAATELENAYEDDLNILVTTKAKMASSLDAKERAR